MHACPDVVAVDDRASREELERAAQVLAGDAGIVLFERAVALRPARHAIRCEVIDAPDRAYRCAEEYKVLIENAARRLSASSLAPLLPGKSLQWVVVVGAGMGAREVWPTSGEGAA